MATKKYIVIDDDPVFLKIISTLAQKRQIQVDTYESLEALGSVCRITDYDAALVDYDLGCLTGVDVGRYLSALLGDKPMVLCSSNNLVQQEGWPRSIKSFISKQSGHNKILDKLISV